MPRIAKADLIAALERAANYIRAAASEDGQTTRNDMRRKLRELRGIDRLLTDVLYRFIDHRNGKAGASISEESLGDALTFLRKELITLYDLRKNRLTTEESDSMAMIGSMCVQLARQLKRAAQQEADLHPAELADKLGELALGLTFDDYASESSEGLESFFLEVELSNLTESSFSQALELDPVDPKQVIERKLPAAGLFERFIDIQKASHKASALELVETLKAHLYDLTIIILGEDDPELDPIHPVYIVGLNRKGNIVGLKSKVVWTD